MVEAEEGAGETEVLVEEDLARSRGVRAVTAGIVDVMSKSQYDRLHV